MDAIDRFIEMPLTHQAGLAASVLILVAAMVGLFFQWFLGWGEGSDSWLWWKVGYRFPRAPLWFWLAITIGMCGLLGASTYEEETADEEGLTEGDYQRLEEMQGILEDAERAERGPR